MNLKSLRKIFERFFIKNRYKGIPNLMLYVSLGAALVFLMSMVTQSSILYSILCFNRNAIFHGQIWRLFTYPLTYGMGSSNPLLIFIGLFCYYSLGRAMEAIWGTCKFNIFYLSGILMMDIYSLIFGCQADAYYLNLSLFLSYATLFPNAQFLLFFIIPVRAWIFALFDLVLILPGLLLNAFPYNLFPLIALANYFLFFGSDVLNLLPASWRRKMGLKAKGPNAVPFRKIVKTEAKPQRPAYNHRCSVCGRTDISNPELDFRYCSRCNGYYCYCSEHINNHTHIE